MSNKRTCSFLVVLLITLICQRGISQRVSFQSRPYEIQASDESPEYQPFASEYSNSFGKLTPNQSSNTGLSFASANNAQNGFQRGSAFGNFERDEKDRRAWNHGHNVHNQRGHGHNWSNNGEKAQGIGSSLTQESKKNSGFGDNSKWNSGFQHTDSGNQVNSNSFLNFGSDPPEKNNGFNTNSGWNPGIQKEDSGNKEHQISPGKKIPGDSWNAHSNNWNSGFNSEKKQGVSQTGTNSWKPQDSQHLPNQFKPIQTNHIKPGSSNAVTNHWHKVPIPDTVNHKKPQKGHGNYNSWTQEPSGSSSNSKPGSKGEQIDWSNLEKPNKKSTLVVDLSQLWDSNDRKNSNQNTARSKKRNVSTNHGNDCNCVEYDECDPEGRVDISHVFGSDNSHLRFMVADCANKNKICCSTPLRTISKKSYESDKYEIQGTDLRPTCGRRISKRTPNDETGEGLANYGDFPWILRLIKVDEDGESEKTLCSASLIHSSVALTTASCALLGFRPFPYPRLSISGPGHVYPWGVSCGTEGFYVCLLRSQSLTGENIKARAGEWNTGTGHERNNIQEAKVGKTFLHPDFDFASYTNDLALIFLDQAFDSNLGTNSVCLPSPNDAWDSSRCLVSGWFKKDVQGTEMAVLTKTDLTNVIRGKCPNTSEYATSDAVMEDTGYICAHARSGDPCIADAGALMCPLYNSDMLVQIGFLSQSGICNEFYKTGTFIDIMESIDWITHMEGIYLYFRNKQFEQ